MATRPKRPRDPMQRAKLIGDIATGEVPNDSPKGPESHITQVRRAAGIKGGKARAKKLSPRKRKAIARKGGKARVAPGRTIAADPMRPGAQSSKIQPQ